MTHSIEGKVEIPIDPEKASLWLYPSNVPARQYQIDIVQTALFENTLVCLPTGLGKTLIAAVVMYNFYNWFPKGKIVFMAPTKPLVDQQREACMYRVSIAQEDTAEMTGRQKPDVRKALWKDKRVFFCTPQVFENDLAKGVMSPMAFVCVVVDECHKSTGNYATVKSVQFLKSHGVQFRVLGLSATPGRTQAAIQDMINNLMINAVEFRDDNDPEIRQHTHAKAIEAVTVFSQPELSKCQRMCHTVLEAVIEPLKSAGVLHVNSAESVTRFGLVTAMQGFRMRSRQYRNGSRLSVLFNQAIFLTSVGENLDCGIRVTSDFITTALKEKPYLREIMTKHATFVQLTEHLKKLVSFNYEHPKFQKLLEILHNHFAKASTGSRVIIFTSLRDTVVDIVDALDRRHGHGISARWFIGQGTGSSSGKQKMTQSQQKTVLEDFRAGKFNTLVATCIAEEGLDIPEVQLIVCYDGAASPLRDTQRMGRTGRHGEGQVIYLLSEGKERRKYDRNKNESGYIKGLLRRPAHHFKLCDASPRMIPAEFQPQMLMLLMETTKPSKTQKKGKKRDRDSRTIDNTKQTKLDGFLSASKSAGNATSITPSITNSSKDDNLQMTTIDLCDEEMTESETAVEDTTNQDPSIAEVIHVIQPQNLSSQLTPKTITETSSSQDRSAENQSFTAVLTNETLSKDGLSDTMELAHCDQSSLYKATNGTAKTTSQKISTGSGKETASVAGLLQRTDISDVTKMIFLMPNRLTEQNDRLETSEVTSSFATPNATRSVKNEETEDGVKTDTTVSEPQMLVIRQNYRDFDNVTTPARSDVQEICTPMETPPPQTLEGRENYVSLLDIDAVVSGTDSSTSDQSEEAKTEDLEFIDDAEQFIPDSTDMALYRRIESESARTPTTTRRTTSSFQLTPGATPFSKQSAYESSFITDADTVLSVSTEEASVEHPRNPRRQLCDLCQQPGRFVTCCSCRMPYHIVCISFHTTISGEMICSNCQVVQQQQSE